MRKEKYPCDTRNPISSGNVNRKNTRHLPLKSLFVSHSSFFKIMFDEMYKEDELGNSTEALVEKASKGELDSIIDSHAVNLKCCDKSKSFPSKF